MRDPSSLVNQFKVKRIPRIGEEGNRPKISALCTAILQKKLQYACATPEAVDGAKVSYGQQ